MSIQTLRKQIDEIDARIVRLLNQRVQVAQRIGVLKRRAGHRAVDPQRERAILARLRRTHRGPLTSGGLRAIYRQIFLNTRAAQQTRSRLRR